MKKRAGFVSNSSSSSFIFALKNADDVTEVGDKKLIFISHADMGEGRDVIEIKTNDTLLLLRHTDCGNVYEYYIVSSEYSDDYDDLYNWDNDTINENKIKKVEDGYEVEQIDWDQHSCRSDFEIIERYYDYDNNVIEKIKQNIINKKIKKIKGD